MKKFLFALFLGASLHLQATDLLSNEDFKNGIAPWKGDAEPVATGGAQITLKDKWSKISQTFNSKETSLDFSLTCQSSAGILFTTANTSNLISLPVISAITGIQLNGTASQLSKDTGLIIVTAPADKSVRYVRIPLPSNTSDAQIISGTIPGLTPSAGKTIYIAFPAGTGTITISNFTLAPTPKATASPPAKPTAQ